MPTSKATIRSLARDLGLSRTTVSEALRGSGRVLPTTAERVLTAAAAAGYEHNPLAGTIMSELRRSRGDVFRGLLAIVGRDEPDRPAYARRFFDGLIRGATARAAELRFKVEQFSVSEREMPQRRLDQILHSRGVRGIMLLPTWGEPDYRQIEWSRYSGVYMDYRMEQPALRCICADHFRSMMTALQRLAERGYRRPGVFLPRQQDERLHHRWEGAFLAFQRHHPHPHPVPPLVADALDRDVFSRWFNEHQPDVVLGHLVEAMDWMRACGARVPDSHGFFCLNVVHADQPCAGLDLTPELIGMRSAEVVVAQLHRNERGVPPSFSLTMLPAQWVDGPTIRPAPGRPPAPAGARRRAPRRAASANDGE